MAKANKEMKLDFQIKTIDIIDFEMLNSNLQTSNSSVLNYNVNIEQVFFPENKLVSINTHVDIFQEDKKTKLGAITVNCTFLIANYKDFFNKELNKTSLPDKVIETLNIIAISTTRGVMYSQFRGTMLHNAILPLVNPQELSKSLSK